MTMPPRFTSAIFSTSIALFAGGLLAAFAAAQIAHTTVWDGIYTDDQAARGKVSYAVACASCHGATLGGVDVAPALSGITFLNGWNGTSAADLFGRIHDTMPITDPGSLSGRQVADIQAYIFQANGFPSGGMALPSDPQLMGGLKIVASRPAPIALPGGG